MSVLDKDSLLIRSRDAISRLTTDLSVAAARTTALEAECDSLRARESFLQGQVASAEAEAKALRDSAESARNAMEARIATLQN